MQDVWHELKVTNYRQLFTIVIYFYAITPDQMPQLCIENSLTQELQVL